MGFGNRKSGGDIDGEIGSAYRAIEARSRMESEYNEYRDGGGGFRHRRRAGKGKRFIYWTMGAGVVAGAILGGKILVENNADKIPGASAGDKLCNAKDTVLGAIGQDGGCATKCVTPDFGIPVKDVTTNEIKLINHAFEICTENGSARAIYYTDDPNCPSEDKPCVAVNVVVKPHWKELGIQESDAAAAQVPTSAGRFILVWLGIDKDAGRTACDLALNELKGDIIADPGLFENDKLSAGTIQSSNYPLRLTSIETTSDGTKKPVRLACDIKIPGATG